MWDKIGTHEWLRLPMFYLASYVVSGDKKYYELYSVYRDDALENSRGHNPSIMRCYASLQMQCSLRFIYDYDRDEAVREKVLRLMEENALYGEKTAIANSMEFTKEEHKEELCYCYFPWDKAKTVNSGTFFGYTYINPGQNEHNPENPAFYPVREIAEGAIMASMCPTYHVSESLMNAVDNMAKCIDTENQKYEVVLKETLKPETEYKVSLNGVSNAIGQETCDVLSFTTKAQLSYYLGKHDTKTVMLNLENYT
jgi:hypothetical protein